MPFGFAPGSKKQNALQQRLALIRGQNDLIIRPHVGNRRIINPCVSYSNRQSHLHRLHESGRPQEPTDADLG